MPARHVSCSLMPTLQVHDLSAVSMAKQTAVAAVAGVDWRLDDDGYEMDHAFCTGVVPPEPALPMVFPVNRVALEDYVAFGMQKQPPTSCGRGVVARSFYVHS